MALLSLKKSYVFYSNVEAFSFAGMFDHGDVDIEFKDNMLVFETIYLHISSILTQWLV